MLTDAKLRKLKPEAKRKRYTDEKGMYLEITPQGGMYWRLKYKFNKKENVYSIGTYPNVSLAEARTKRNEAKKILAQGIDPNRAKKNHLMQIKGENTFNYVATEWHTKESKSWAQSTAKKIKSRLDGDLIPFLGDKDIAKIDAFDLLPVIQRIERRSPDVARRVLQILGQIFRYAASQLKVSQDPSQLLRGSIKPLPTKHYAAMTNPDDVAKLLIAIDGYHGTFVTYCALKLAPLFFVRIGDLRKAKWADIDFEKKEWRFVVSKTQTDFIVPLAPQAIEILSSLKAVTGKYEYVFVGAQDRRKPMSENTINAALRRLGYDTQNQITGHGFRAMARTILHEQLGCDRDVIEHQLAHRVPDALGTAYNRTRFIQQRTEMMTLWANYLDHIKQGQ